MTDTNQLPQLPTLRPGDSHMESLIEAAIQGHASTREAMRWLVRQLVPATQPAEVTDAEIDALCLSLTGFMTRKERDRAVARTILALRPVQVPMTDERSVSVKVDRELFSFHSEQDWVNKARSRYANCGVQKGHYITVDAAGHVMHMGLCFKHAAYPVTVYQLQTNWPKEQA